MKSRCQSSPCIRQCQRSARPNRSNVCRKIVFPLLSSPPHFDCSFSSLPFSSSANSQQMRPDNNKRVFSKVVHPVLSLPLLSTRRPTIVYDRCAALDRFSFHSAALWIRPSSSLPIYRYKVRPKISQRLARRPATRVFLGSTTRTFMPEKSVRKTNPFI